MFRTAPGEKLDAVWQNAPAAFEIDGWDTPTRTGWSVLVRGRTEAIHDETEIAELESSGTREVGALRAAHHVGPDSSGSRSPAGGSTTTCCAKTSIPIKCEAEAGCLPSGRLRFNRAGQRNRPAGSPNHLEATLPMVTRLKPTRPWVAMTSIVAGVRAE